MSAGCAAQARRAVRELDLVDHARCGGDQVEIIFAGQPLLDDLQMQQTEEPATEPKPNAAELFRLEAETRVVQPAAL